MGSPTTDRLRGDDELEHQVTLTRGFWMWDHEVTQAEYKAVMAAEPTLKVDFTGYSAGPNKPVLNVSWNDAVEFCWRLTYRDVRSGWILPSQAYRLPTEAEWEYAARAGTTGDRYGHLDAIAWYKGNTDRLRPVRERKPNAFGLYDMLGNASEWCADWYGWYSSERVTDPKGPEGGKFRVLRGGSYMDTDGFLRSAERGDAVPDWGYSTVGFRPVLSSVP